MTTPSAPPDRYIAPPRRSPVPSWRRLRRYAIRGIACCAAWPLGLVIAGLSTGGVLQSPILSAATGFVSVVSIASFSAFFAAKAALWWHGES